MLANFSHISRAHISKTKKVFQRKILNILFSYEGDDFQICISVSLDDNKLFQKIFITLKAFFIKILKKEDASSLLSCFS